MKQKVGTYVGAVTAAAALCAACIVGTACSSTGASSSSDALTNTADTSGGVAVTVNDVQIGENVITSYIDAYRSAMSLETDDAWGEWLVEYGYTPEDIRSDTIDYYTNQELLRQAAEKYNVSVSDSEVETQVESVRSQFDTDEEWQEALSSSAMTEDSYYEYIKLSLLEEALIQAVGADAKASDEEVLESVQTYAPYYDGAKRSSHILFDSENEALAQEVLDKINSGELTFDEAVDQYANNDAVIESGDVGWDQLSSFVDEYQDALDQLNVGEVSGLVTSEYGIHIIECTDELVVPDEITSLDDISAGFVETMRESLDEDAEEEAYEEWMATFEDESVIEVTDMPEGLPYDIDLTPYEEAAAAEETEESAADTEEETSGDTAAEESTTAQ